VTCSGVIETVEENFGFLIGNIVVISVGQKDHFRQCECIDTIKSDFKASEPLRTFPENGSLVEDSVVIGVFENDNSIF
jgi:hypothetical protein